MRILFLSHRFYPDVGGIQVNSEILANQFQAMGHTVTLATWTTEHGDRSFAFDVVRNPGASELFSLHRQADVVFENNPCLRLAWPSLFYKSANVAALRTWVARNDGTTSWQDKLKTYWLNRADAVIAVSKAVARYGPEHTYVIGNPYRNDLFRKTNNRRNPLSFVFMGRLVSSKGCDIALEAFAKFAKNYNPDGTVVPELTVIGDGEVREALEKRTAELKLSESVTFTGFLEGSELVDALNRCAYLLMPSLLVEAFGNVALEAMACGCLPIVSDTGGLPDAVGKAGVVVENPNAQTFYTAISELVKHPEREKVLRSESAGHLKNFTPDVVAKKYMDVLLAANKKRNEK